MTHEVCLWWERQLGFRSSVDIWWSCSKILSSGAPVMGFKKMCSNLMFGSVIFALWGCKIRFVPWNFFKVQRLTKFISLSVEHLSLQHQAAPPTKCCYGKSLCCQGATSVCLCQPQDHPNYSFTSCTVTDWYIFLFLLLFVQMFQCQGA